MNTTEYSIIIRTLGTAGSKYKELLKSINRQNVPPKEVIVVIPFGYDLPSERLGYEKFIRSEKGMVIQRCVGLSAMTTEVGLFLDDDLSFGECFSEALLEGLGKFEADVVFPIYREFLPQTIMQKFISAVTFSAIPFFNSTWYTKIYRNGSYGYSISNLLKDSYNAMTAPGTCFLVRRNKFEEITFEDERWLEDTQYALPDDQVMFYKFYINNCVIKGLTTCTYNHLDAGGQTPGRAKIAAFAMARNKLVFWHRFIFNINKSYIERFLSLICYFVTITISLLFSSILSLFQFKKFDILKQSISGLISGCKYIQSAKYKGLPNVIK